MTTRTKALVWAACAVAVLFCAVAGRVYWLARQDDSLRYAASRDAALAAGRERIAELNTLDVKNIDSGLGLWLHASTGALHDKLAATRATDRTTLTKAGTSARGTVTDAALTALDYRAGTAALIATVKVAVTPRGGTATTDRKRFTATLARTREGWKVTALSAVPVGKEGA
ncbi:hypothetical protein G3I19_30195 [Streptomyces sp. SID10853]|uniref:hypothetical protein n=1 Tax=Streptomyces sp. SID10853 TaxID=2706028 RepID=UPI0013BF882B|nr:hypothetical protein [Streptomyces sp. SID10853]NDZ82730.1 hypothetical protein [Streptomyces sp. SID10853]